IKTPAGPIIMRNGQIFKGQAKGVLIDDLRISVKDKWKKRAGQTQIRLHYIYLKLLPFSVDRFQPRWGRNRRPNR
ncbi:MAG: hypothetical protein PVF86_17170, partial [Desulfobacterales bacterium]